MLISNWRLWSSHKCRKFAESIGESDKWDGVWRRHSIPTTFRMPPPCVPFDAESRPSRIRLLHYFQMSPIISRFQEGKQLVSLYLELARNHIGRRFSCCCWFFSLMQCSTGVADGWLRAERGTCKRRRSFWSFHSLLASFSYRRDSSMINWKFCFDVVLLACADINIFSISFHVVADVALDRVVPVKTEKKKKEASQTKRRDKSRETSTSFNSDCWAQNSSTTTKTYCIFKMRFHDEISVSTSTSCRVYWSARKIAKLHF